MLLTGHHSRAVLIQVLLLFAIDSGFAEAGEVPRPGVGPSATFGLNRQEMPVAPHRHLSISGHGGYGISESMGSIDGAHHRLFGRLSIGAAPIESVGVHLSLSGIHDRHPDDSDGGDTTTIGLPSLGIRAGRAFGQWLQLGAAVNVIIPGGDAPSLAFEATTLEPRILFAAAPKEARFRVVLSAGYRWDNTNAVAPGAETLRPGDRISIGTSEFDAVLLGLGGSISLLSATELLAEVTSALFVGNGAPTASSPVRLGVGVRHRLLDALQLSLLTETLVTGRPGLGADDPFIPVEPRFTMSIGVTYTFDLSRPVAKPATETPAGPARAGPPDPEPTPTVAAEGRLEGQVVDEEGNPIGGTTVTYTTTDAGSGEPQRFETTTDGTGGYELTRLPIGSGTLTIAIDGFESMERAVRIAEAPQAQPPDVLVQSEFLNPTQLRGQIRSIDGAPLVARLTIKPLGRTIETDETGYFSLDIPEGRYRVSISAPGHRTQKKQVVIEDNSVTIINVDLRKK